MTPDALRAHTRRELAALARGHQVQGWHDMRKEELIEALIGTGRGLKSESRSGGARRVTSRRTLAPRTRSVRSPVNVSAQPVRQPPPVPTARATRPRLVPGVGAGAASDRLVATANGPYWLQATWHLTARALKRAEASLAHEWHLATPVVRVYETSTNEGTPQAQRWIRDVEVHGEVDHWYIPVDNPPRGYRLEIGYRTPSGRFFVLAKSNLVRTMRPGGKGTSGKPWSAAGGNGTACATREAAVEQLRGRLRERAALLNSSPNVGDAHGRRGDVPFRLDTEIIVHGCADPRTELTFLGEPVPLGKDGSFALHFRLPDGRHVIPAVAVARDGGEQRTIVLAIERNTKELEPHCPDDLTT